MSVPESRPQDAAAHRHDVGAACAGHVPIAADRNHRVGFAYLGNQMGGYGDARARDLTAALRAAIGA